MRKYIFYTIFCALAILVAVPVRAAVLSVQADNNVFGIGDEFTAVIKIDSEGAGINAAQANITYPANILRIESASKANSIFNFWLTDPVFDNAAGTLTFTGGATNGYNGKSLTIFSINFKVLSAGRASIKLTDGAVTASDGSGTNVLRLLQGVEIVSAAGTAVTGAPATPPAGGAATGTAGQPIALPPQILPPPTQIARIPTPAPNAPAAPKIKVPLYPASGAWSGIVANFLVQWTLPSDITDVATAVNSNPKFNPTQSEGLFDNKFFPALKEGVSYVHISFKNNVGWGETTHYKIAIDTVPPAPFDVKLQSSVEKDGSTANPEPTIAYQSADQLSGLEKYSIQIDNNAAVDTKVTKFTLPLQKPGQHSVKVEARDFAGNGTEARAVINILPIASPLITSLTKEIFTAEGGLNISGTALPNVTAELNLKSSIGEILATRETPVDKNGDWAAKFDTSLKKGIYFVDVYVRDEKGAESFVATSDAVKVKARPVLSLFGLQLSETWFYLLIITILLIGFGAGYLTYYLWRQQLGRRVVIARRDVAGVLGEIDKDLDLMLKNYSDNKIDEYEAEEMHRVLQRIKTRATKMSKYLSQTIEEIKD